MGLLDTPGSPDIEKLKAKGDIARLLQALRHKKEEIRLQANVKEGKMAANLCPFCNFQSCKNDCNFFHINKEIKGCILSKGLLFLLQQQNTYEQRLEKIEQYLLDASNSLIDINSNTR